MTTLTMYQKVEKILNDSISIAFNTDEGETNDIILAYALLNANETRELNYKLIACNLGLVDYDHLFLDWYSRSNSNYVKDIYINTTEWLDTIKETFKDSYEIVYNDELSCFGEADEMVQFYAENFCSPEGEFLLDYMDFIDTEKLADYWCRSDECIGKIDGDYFRFG